MPDSYADTGKKIGDLAVEHLRRHEGEVHGGERCHDETVNLIAYLCHRVGLHFAREPSADTLAPFRALVERTADYHSVHDEHHVDRDHA